MSVSIERNALARVSGRPTLRRREQWGSTFVYVGRWTVQSPAVQAFIHITVTNPGNYNSNDAHARGIEAIGRSRFPSTGGSYNRLVMLNAALYELQPMLRQGAHTVNDHRLSRCTRWGSACPGHNRSLAAPSWNNNVTARAYALAMNVGNTVSDALVDNLARQIAADYLAGLLTLDAARYPHGHRCVSSKDCPGSRMWNKMRFLQERIVHHINTRLGAGSAPPPKEEPMSEEVVRNAIGKLFAEAAERSTPAGRALGSNLRAALDRAGAQTQPHTLFMEQLTPARIVSDEKLPMSISRSRRQTEHLYKTQIPQLLEAVRLLSEQIDAIGHGSLSLERGFKTQLIGVVAEARNALEEFRLAMEEDEEDGSEFDEDNPDPDTD